MNTKIHIYLLLDFLKMLNFLNAILFVGGTFKKMHYFCINEKLYANAENEYNILLKDAEGVNTYNINYYADANEKALEIYRSNKKLEEGFGVEQLQKAILYCRAKV